MTVLLVIGILVFLILFHELGHFIAAKFFKVRVEEFGIGFPPRAFLLGIKNGTEYTLNWIPFGGFVRLFGDIGDEKHGAGSFIDKNRGVQAIILVAGVFANIIAAWILFTGALYVGTPRLVATPEEGARQFLIIADVIPNSPASLAGLAAGDKIVSLFAQGDTPEELTPEGVGEFISERGGEPFELSIVRGASATTTVIVRSAHAVIPDAAEKPAIGVVLGLVVTNPLPLWDAMKGATASTYNAFAAVLAGFGDIIRDILEGSSPLKNLVGPVGLVGVVGVAAESGLGNVLSLAAFISVNLVIINLLPIPALDGGRLFVLGLEAIARRNAPRIVVSLFNILGIAFIVFLMVTITWNDIARLLV